MLFAGWEVRIVKNCDRDSDCRIRHRDRLEKNNIQKHPDSVCENDVNNEQNVRGYYMSNHWTRGWFSTAKKLLVWLLFFGKSIQNILILSVRMT